jgi:hypothetical protein
MKRLIADLEASPPAESAPVLPARPATAADGPSQPQ